MIAIQKGMAMALLAVGIVLASLSNAQQEDQAEMERDEGLPTKKQVVQLLFPCSFDMPSKQEVENMNRVMSFGSPVLPVLGAILAERDDPLDVNRVLDVASRIDGDKTPLLRELPALLKMPHWRIKVNAIKALQRWGDVDDCKYILPLVSTEEERVRLHALRALGQLGNLSVASELEKVLTHHKTLVSAEKQKTDSTLKYGYRALSNIVERTATQHLEQTPDSSEDK
ncbi:MAG: HEAT repeat domain-containing protein [Kiritimatiellia bacterium]|jgi:hypothetical protein|nr:HEAT repeat domain-containing protein [Kiritimatiellia bacterium]